MLSLKQKAVALSVVAGMNLLVLLFLGWFVVFSLAASLPFALVILKR